MRLPIPALIFVLSILSAGIGFAPAPALAQPTPPNCANLPEGYIRDGVTSCARLLGVNSDGSINVNSTPATGTGDVNIKQFGGTNTTLGQKAAAASIPVVIASDQTLATGVAQASTTSGQLGPLIQGATTTNAPTYTAAQTNPVSLDTHGGTRVVVQDSAGAALDYTTPAGVVGQPTSSSTYQLIPTITQSGSTGVVKASAGNLYGTTITTITGQGPGFFMVFNTTSVPGDGVVTPQQCVAVPAGPTSVVWDATTGMVPEGYSIGISWAFSTGANCQTKTAATANFVRSKFQ